MSDDKDEALERDNNSKCYEMSEDFADDIAKECGVNIRHGAPSAELSSFKGGGEIVNLFLPSNIEKFVKVLSMLTDSGQKPYILGGGSNTIFADGKINHVVVSTAMLNEISIVNDCNNKHDCTDKRDCDDKRDFDDKCDCSGKNGFSSNRIYAECGVRVQDIISVARENGLGGFEFLSGIPATVGGILKMNASAFGQETADKVVEMYTLSHDCATIEKILKKELGFSYRNGATDTVVAAVFQLETMSNDLSHEHTLSYIEQRTFKQPKYPSVGSVFKNPNFDGAKAAAMYIEQAGLKGKRCGGAEISEKHANFIVNKGGACSNDFITLVELAELATMEMFGVKLEREFEYVK